MLGKKLIQAASGNAAGGGLGIEDVFSTWLYTGNGSTQTITNGIDLAGEGGLVWCKSRSDATLHELVDTARGVRKRLDSASTAAEVANADLEAFNSDGFRLGFHTGGANSNGSTYASWTFRKAPGFFDVVTYTGNGSAQTIAHNLGSAPGCIIIKRTNDFGHWAVYHRSRGTAEIGFLSSTIAFQPTAGYFTSVSDTVFAISNAGDINASGGTYVAYLFAHDEQIFGEGGDQSVIKCGSYTGTSTTTGPFVDLGWEPQWLLIKRATATGGWYIFDSMRGLVTGGADRYLLPNASSAEQEFDLCDISATGFTPKGQNSEVNSDNQFIYIAIRRGPMKTPTSGTEVFKTEAVTSDANSVTTGFPVDLAIDMSRIGVAHFLAARLTGANALRSNLTDAEAVNVLARWWDSNTVMKGIGATAQPAAYQIFRRAPGFFDVVAYTGTGVAKTVAHNLGVAPELMIVKGRNVLSNWSVYHSAAGATQALLVNDPGEAFLNSDRWNNVAPNGDSFTIGTNGDVNAAAFAYIAYLFATLPGVSKVFSFTGNGTSQTIDCGFAAGARFVLLKRTDSAGNWLVADTARGIISGNDPLLYLNSTAAEITTLDWIDPHSSGFIVNQESTANANVGGATYIGLAIA